MSFSREVRLTRIWSCTSLPCFPSISSTCYFYISVSASASASVSLFLRLSLSFSFSFWISLFPPLSLRPCLLAPPCRNRSLSLYRTSQHTYLREQRADTARTIEGNVPERGERGIRGALRPIRTHSQVLPATSKANIQISLAKPDAPSIFLRRHYLGSFCEQESTQKTPGGCVHRSPYRRLQMRLAGKNTSAPRQEVWTEAPVRTLAVPLVPS